jgi:hypothetical protein
VVGVPHQALRRFVHGQKLHAADGKSPKSNWRPAGAKSGDPLFPVAVQRDGTVWVCPGELIALAVSSLGLSAIGITSGEKTSHDMTQLVELLRGRRVGIVGDNDSAGHKWAYWMSSQLAGAGIEVRVVDLGLTRKGEDLGDWIVERRVNQQASVSDVSSALNEAFSSASCISAPVDTATQSPSEEVEELTSSIRRLHPTSAFAVSPTSGAKRKHGSPWSASRAAFTSWMKYCTEAS